MRLRRHFNGEILSVTPADLVGSGGEARVYIVPGGEALAAKVYHRPTETQRRKISVMLQNAPEDPTREIEHISIAWPLDLLSMAHGDRRFAGFLMPRVDGMRPIFQVYNPSARRQALHDIDYRFLHRAARNLASAVNALHGRGYVIGDVNESNILVGPSALVTLVDTDSFQVLDPQGGQTFRCPVGKAEYTAPEIQGKPFSSFDRTPEHDRFGLAVLIFQLLMEGAHPYSGRYEGLGEPPPYEQRIASGQFTYGVRRTPFRPAPAAPPFELLDPALRQLFLRCFEDGFACPPARPDPLTWQRALAHAERAMVVCEVSPLHRFGGHLDLCPWCRRTSLLSGRDPFPAGDGGSERAPKRVPASRYLPAGNPINKNTQSRPRRPAPTSPSPPPPIASNWQNSAPLTASAANAAPAAFPTPTLFSVRLEGTGWLCGALFWTVLALASAPLGLTGLNWLTALLAVACAAAGWMTGRKSARFGRWIAAGSAFLAFASLAFRPLTSPAHAVGAERMTAGVGGVRALSFSPDGATLAAGTSRPEDASLAQGEVNIWGVGPNRLLSTPERTSGDVVSVAFSPDGKSLVAGTDSPFGTGEVVVLDVSANNAYRSVFKVSRHLRQVAWSPDGSCFASVGAERLVRIWDAKALTLTAAFELPGEATTIAFSADGQTLAVGCGSSQGSVAPGYLSVWNIARRRLLWSKPAHGNGVAAAAFSPRGDVLASGGNDGAVCLWDPLSGRLLNRRTAHSYGIAALAFAPNGSEFACAEFRQGDQGPVHEIVLRDALTGAPLRTLTGDNEVIQALAFAPGGGLLAGGGSDGSIRLWKLPLNQRP